MKQSRPDFTVTLQTLRGQNIPAEVRLRRFLKLALRMFGLKCLTVNGKIPEPAGRDDDEPANNEGPLL